METIKTIDLDQIQLPNPRPGPLPFPTADMIDLAASAGLHTLPRMRVRMQQDGFELVTGVLTFRIANVFQHFRVEVEVMELEDHVARSLMVMDFMHATAPLSPLQMGRLILQLCKNLKISLAECGRRLGINHRREASRYVRLLSLPDEIIQLIETQKLEVGTARCLIPLTKVDQISLAQQASHENWTTQKMEQVCRQRQGKEATKNKPVTKSQTLPSTAINGQGLEHIKDQEATLSDTIGSRVEVLFNPQTKSVQLVIHCANLDVYEGVTERLVPPGQDKEEDGFYI